MEDLPSDLRSVAFCRVFSPTDEPLVVVGKLFSTVDARELSKAALCASFSATMLGLFGT